MRVGGDQADSAQAAGQIGAKLAGCDFDVVVIGHTDNVGGDVNEKLSAYRAEKERLAGLGLDRGAYAEAKVAWFAAAHPRATAWATSTSWTPDPAPAPDPPTA